MPVATWTKRAELGQRRTNRVGPAATAAAAAASRIYYYHTLRRARRGDPECFGRECVLYVMAYIMDAAECVCVCVRVLLANA